MAIWQYDFFIVPFGSDVDIVISKDESGYKIDDDLLWRNVRVKRDIFIKFGEFLGYSKHWCNEADLYGKLDANCLEVYFGDEYLVESVMLRLNKFENHDRFFKFLVEFCVKNGFVVLGRKFQELPLDANKLSDLLKFFR